MNRRGLGSERDIDGKWYHYFSQSLLNDFQMCPEKARNELYGLVPRIESPKMALGTSFHAAAEAVLRDIDVLCMTRSMEEAFNHYADLLVSTFEDRTYLTEFRPEEGYDIDWARKRGVSALSTWWDDVLPNLKPMLIEEPFEYKLYEDDERVIYMKGTIDLVQEDCSILDWKTSGSERKAWKDQRGSIQAATYTRAVAEQYGLSQVKFDYIVLHEKGMQRVELVQGLRHWNWLAEQAKSLARLVEADIPQWPVIDTDWWCNVNWCPVFAARLCKGEFFPEGFGAAKRSG